MTHKKWRDAEQPIFIFQKWCYQFLRKKYPKESESNKLAPSGTTSHVKRYGTARTKIASNLNNKPFHSSGCACALGRVIGFNCYPDVAGLAIFIPTNHDA